MKYIVIKVGGSTITKVDETLFQDINHLKSLGYVPIIVHGGGPFINQALIKAQILPEFLNGIRKTDEDILKVVVETLICEVNAQLVEQANQTIHHYIGLTCAQHPVFECEAIQPELGFVAKPKSTNTELLAFISQKYVPIIASIGKKDHQYYNVNADAVAYQIAADLKAPLYILSDVPGILKNGEVIPIVNFSDIQQMIADGTIYGGMIPKVEDAKQALENGAQKVTILPGDVTHALQNHINGLDIGTSIEV